MAAQYGCARFVGQSGRIYYKDLYFDDTAGNRVNFDSGSGAGAATATDLSFKEDVALTSLVLAAATAQTKTQILVNETPTGDIVRNSLHLVSVTNRPALGVPIQKGLRVALVQLA